ncbi:NADH dehydrogenase [ubiquinone] 1 alpha subcomplex subunit 10, mitochondrial, partial [Intoshia linei]
MLLRNRLQQKGKYLINQFMGMKEMFGEKYPYKPPFENVSFWERDFPFVQKMPGLSENSKIITVEGNMCSGKTKFAKELANCFDLKLFNPITDRDIYYDNKVDLRVFDPVLTDRAKIYTLDKFYSNEKRFADKTLVCRLQLNFFKKKFYQYIEALKHLIYTGQGVVLVNSAIYDYAYTETLYKNGYITKNFYDYMKRLYKFTIPEFFYPHLIVNLDIPSKDLFKNIKNGKRDREKNSKFLTENFLNEIRNGCQIRNEKYKKYCELIEVDVSKPLVDVELDEIFYDISKMQLDPPEYPKWNDIKFYHWQYLSVHLVEELIISYDENRLDDLFDQIKAVACPEYLVYGEEVAQWT